MTFSDPIMFTLWTAVWDNIVPHEVEMFFQHPWGRGGKQPSAIYFTFLTSINTTINSSALHPKPLIKSVQTPTQTVKPITMYH